MMVTGYLPVSGGLAHLAKAAGCVGGVGLQPQTELGAGVRPNVRQCRSDGADPAAAKDLHFYKVRNRAAGKLVVVPAGLCHCRFRIAISACKGVNRQNFGQAGFTPAEAVLPSQAAAQLLTICPGGHPRELGDRKLHDNGRIDMTWCC